MRTSVIAAMGQNHVIGDDRGLPWRLPRDLRRFRELTWGKPVIMGRKTLELIARPLPGRENIVLTRNRSYQERGFHVAHDVQAALACAQRLLDRQAREAVGPPADAPDEVMVIGGGDVYRQFIGLADLVYLTVVEGSFPGTAAFPFAEMASLRWQVLKQETHPADSDNPYPHRFYVLGRSAGAGAIEPGRLLAG